MSDEEILECFKDTGRKHRTVRRACGSCGICRIAFIPQRQARIPSGSSNVVLLTGGGLKDPRAVVITAQDASISLTRQLITWRSSCNDHLHPQRSKEMLRGRRGGVPS
ncbi:MAG: hypothetical protein MZV63_49150 [Marinilabiliales bacterium]|nr:hypothetical protein [Marinilabiliales bacterium]